MFFFHPFKIAVPLTKLTFLKCTSSRCRNVIPPMCWCSEFAGRWVRHSRLCAYVCFKKRHHPPTSPRARANIRSLTQKTLPLQPVDMSTSMLTYWDSYRGYKTIMSEEGTQGGMSMPGRERTAVAMVTDEDASLTLQHAPEYFQI